MERKERVVTAVREAKAATQAAPRTQQDMGRDLQECCQIFSMEGVSSHQELFVTNCMASVAGCWVSDGGQSVMPAFLAVLQVQGDNASLYCRLAWCK